MCFSFLNLYLLRFSSDPVCQTIDQQFLWGSALLISPVVEQGAVEVEAYMPPGTWYSLHNVSQLCMQLFIHLPCFFVSSGAISHEEVCFLFNINATEWQFSRVIIFFAYHEARRKCAFSHG